MAAMAHGLGCRLQGHNQGGGDCLPPWQGGDGGARTLDFDGDENDGKMMGK